MSIDRGIDQAGATPVDVAEPTARHRRGGLSTTQAANIIAYLSGEDAAACGWTTREIERLLFVDWLVAAGRLRS